MRQRRPQTFDELLAQTSTRWEYHPEGLDFVVMEEGVAASPDRLVIEIPKSARARFRPKPGERFVARMRRGKLIVER